jgi:hypothetical protein
MNASQLIFLLPSFNGKKSLERVSQRERILFSFFIEFAFNVRKNLTTLDSSM